MVDRYLATVQSENTRRAYAKDLQTLCEWLVAANVTVTELRPKHLEAYRSYLLSEFAPATVNRRLAAAKSFLRWLARNEEIDERVVYAASTVPTVKVPEKLPRLLTEDQIQDLFCAPDIRSLEGTRDLAFIRLLLSSGVRLAEAIGLDIADLDVPAKRAVVYGKGQKERVVFFDEETKRALNRYLALRNFPQSGPVFVNKEGSRISGRWFQRQLSEYGGRIGRGDLHPHLLRHQFATQLQDSRGDLDLVQRLLGHSSVATTQRYIKLANRRTEAAYREAMDSDGGLEQRSGYEHKSIPRSSDRVRSRG